MTSASSSRVASAGPTAPCSNLSTSPSSSASPSNEPHDGRKATDGLVLGCGAIGSTLAGSLTRAGRDVTAVHPRFQHVEGVRTDGLTVVSPEEQFTTRFDALHVDELDQLERPADVLVLSSKYYDTEWMARFGQVYPADNVVVIAAQDGVMEERPPNGCPTIDSWGASCAPLGS